MRVHYEILNQKGTPAFYSDTYTNRPTYGFAGRVFISTDTGQIFEDTGSAWSLIADAGVGGGTLASVTANGNTTATGIIITAGGLSSNSFTNTGITAGSLLFAGTGGLQSQDNTNLFWDNTSKYLGIQTNSPGAPLDIHLTSNIGIQINNTTTGNSNIAFQNASVAKWRIGNVYNAGANSFDVYNVGLASNTFSINNSTNATTFTGPLILSNVASGGYGIQINNSLGAGFVALREPDDSYTLGMTSPTFTTVTIHANNSPSYINTTGNFGFGNASPSYKVDITGTLRTTTGASFATSSGNVLIGTTTDAGYKLDVNGQGRFIGALTGAAATFSGIITSQVNGSIFGTASASGRSITLQASSGGGVILFKNAAGGDATLSLLGTSTTGIYQFNTYSVGDAFVIQNNGYIGIGTGSPSYQLQLTTDSAAKPTSALWTIASDKRIKENINPYNKGLEDLLRINPITYDYNGLGGFAKGKGGVGIIAQEIIDILPNSVSSIKAKLYETDEEEIDILNFNGHELIYVLINSMKELNEKLVRNNIN